MKRIILFTLLNFQFFTFSCDNQRKSQSYLFKENKAQLSSELQKFLDDFSGWSSKEKESITFINSVLIIDGLGIDSQKPYGGSLLLWLNKRLSGDLKSRKRLFKCLEYLKKINN